MKPKEEPSSSSSWPLPPSFSRSFRLLRTPLFFYPFFLLTPWKSRFRSPEPHGWWASRPSLGMPGNRGNRSRSRLCSCCGRSSHHCAVSCDRSRYLRGRSRAERANSSCEYVKKGQIRYKGRCREKKEREARFDWQLKSNPVSKSTQFSIFQFDALSGRWDKKNKWKTIKKKTMCY